MNKKAAAAAAATALLVGGAVVWHFTGHAGLDHHGSEHAAHHDHGGATQKLELDDGRRWATDAPLRAGMSKLHAAARPALAAYEEGAFDAEESEQVAQLIRQEVNTLIEKCNLEPRADANLHIIIGELLTAASAMELDPQSEDGVPALVAALHDYSRYFEHPDF